jgi:hypothetical protein
MKFDFEVGEVAKRRIEFEFNQLFGRTVILIDGKEAKRNVRWFSEPLVETHDLQISDLEQVSVKIEKRRNQLLGAQYLVYVNNHLTQKHVGI